MLVGIPGLEKQDVIRSALWSLSIQWNRNCIFPPCWAVQLVSVICWIIKNVSVFPNYCLFSCLSLNYKATVPNCKFEECSGAERATNLNMCNKDRQVEAKRKSISFQSKKRACFSQWCTERSGPLQKWIDQGKENKWLLHVVKIWWEMSNLYCLVRLLCGLSDVHLSCKKAWWFCGCRIRDSGCWLVFGSRFNESTLSAEVNAGDNWIAYVFLDFCSLQKY